ncbi:MAG: hypothetical protein QOK15_2137, partial [Nocardioidaceae bacterium]|nr:hypothetical protein [Nocardioidaceae bacterium]
MSSLHAVILETPELEAATAFYTAFLGPDAPVMVRAGESPT